MVQQFIDQNCAPQNCIVVLHIVITPVIVSVMIRIQVRTVRAMTMIMMFRFTGVFVP